MKNERQNAPTEAKPKSVAPAASSDTKNSTVQNHKEDSGPDPYDLDALRSPKGFVVTKRTALKVRANDRAPKDKFIRVLPFICDHGKEENCLNVTMLSYQFEGEFSKDSFIVMPNSEPFELLFDKLRPTLIVLGVTRGGEKFLWELKLPTGDRRSDEWASTRLTCAMRAQTEWLKPVADIHAGGYNYDSPQIELPDPDWSDVNFKELFQVAYHDRIVTRLDHPVVKEIRGA